MIYLDNGATSFHKPPAVTAAVQNALRTCANPGRGGHIPAMNAAKAVFRCRQRAGALFDCDPEQVVFTANCTQGLNTAIQSLVKPGARVIISGFEHNAVTRPLFAKNAEIVVAGRKLFDWDDMLNAWETALRQGADAAIFTQCSNVYGYCLPYEQLGQLCQKYQVPFIMDAAQGAGTLPISMTNLGADFIAMPGHKGLLGPQGTGILLCRDKAEPLIFGGTGSNSKDWEMPDFLPDRLEAGTLNVPGIAGLEAGMAYVMRLGQTELLRREQRQMTHCVKVLQEMGVTVFSGAHQVGTFSFVPETDCELFAERLANRGIAVRAGLHCAPLAHESGGTLNRGTVRVSFGHNASAEQSKIFCKAAKEIMTELKIF